MKSVLVLNRCNSSNFGDQAIGESIVRQLTSNGYQVDSFDICQIESKFDWEKQDFHPREEPFDLDKYNIKRKSKLENIKTKVKQIINAIRWSLKNEKQISNICRREYDMVIIGGGELIQSNTIFPTAINCWVRNLRKNIPIYFFGVGVTNKYDPLDRRLLKKALSRAKEIYVRDPYSFQNVMDCFGRKAVQIVDVVLGGWEFTPPRKIDLSSSILYGITSFDRIKRYKQLQIESRREYYEYCHRDIIQNYSSEKYEDVILFYSDLQDFLECKSFVAYIKNSYCVEPQIATVKSLEQFVLLVSSAKMIISPRMHACVFGLLYSKATKMIVISEKTQNFNNEYISKDFSFAEIHNILSNAYEQLK